MTRVKNMPRQQQKAVFARMTDDGYLKTLEGAEKASQRRSYIMKRQDLSETYEDKIFNIYNNSKLTHRQKMDKISRLKKEAKGKLSKYQAENSGTVAGEIRKSNWNRFQKKYDIKEVPVNQRKTIADIAQAPTEKLIEKRITIECKKEVEARQEIKEGLLKLQSGIREIGKGDTQKAVKKTREANRQIRKGREELRKAIINKWNFKRSLIEAKNNKNLTFKQLKKKGIKLSPKGDADKDGVKNAKDCRPLDKKKHYVSRYDPLAISYPERLRKFSKDPKLRKRQADKISEDISKELKEIEKEKGKCPKGFKR